MTADNGPGWTAASAAGLAAGDSAAPGDVEISGGLMTWAAAVSGPLAGCTCLWQDLDGLHVEPPPAEVPPTSILWGWRGGSYLVRARLDGDDAYVAVHQAPEAALERAVPWALDDGRVAASAGRGPGPAASGVGARYEQVIVGGIDTGPVTFLRPVRGA
jgi:hypothetical protein